MYRTLWPLPGGAHQYLTSLHALVLIADRAQDTDEALDLILEHFDSVHSRKAAGSYLRIGVILGLLSVDGSKCDLASHGRTFLQRQDPTQILELLRSRVEGVAELETLLREQPRRIGLLHREMFILGFKWSKDTQVRYRLRWLEAVGGVYREGRARPWYGLNE